MAGKIKTDTTLVRFNTGEIAPLLDGRIDLQSMSGACRRLRNMIVTSHGAVVRRPGLRFIASVKGTAPTPTGHALWAQGEYDYIDSGGTLNTIASLGYVATFLLDEPASLIVSGVTVTGDYELTGITDDSDAPLALPFTLEQTGVAIFKVAVNPLGTGVQTGIISIAHNGEGSPFVLNIAANVI